MDYVPHSPDDLRLMLERIGVPGLDDLFDAVPAEARQAAIVFPEHLAPALSEPELLSHMEELARMNRTPADGPWFLGAGSYHHFIPAIVPAITSRGEFLTAYTPYQAELSQGTLQALFEYQSQVSTLLELPVVNASHYDGATALAESVLMAWHAKPGRILLPEGLNPRYRAVVESYLQGIGQPAETWRGTPQAAAAALPPADAPGAPQHGPVSAFVLQWPDFFGRLFELEAVAERVHAAGALFILCTDPLMHGLVRSPGSLGADIACGEGQCLGMPMGFGGPGLGIMACTNALLRRLPGRLVGQAHDAQGRIGYTLTLSAREQHIRREKATSNICSNQGLMALSACVYLATMGPAGLARVGELCRERAWQCAAAIAALPGFGVPALAGGDWCPHFFKEFLVETPVPARGIVQDLAREDGIVAGLALDQAWPGPLPAGLPGPDRLLLVCATELTSQRDIERLARALTRYSRRQP